MKSENDISCYHALKGGIAIKALTVAALVTLCLGFGVDGAIAQETEIITDISEKAKTTALGTPTGFAAELPTPTLDVKHAQDPTTYPNPSAYGYIPATADDYEVKVTDGASSAYGNIELKDTSKYDWTRYTSQPSEYPNSKWTNDYVAGSNVTEDDDTINGAIRMEIPHNGAVPTAWNRWYTFTYTKSPDYDDFIGHIYTSSNSDVNGGHNLNSDNYIGNSAILSGGSYWQDYSSYGGGFYNYGSTISSVTANFIGNSAVAILTGGNDNRASYGGGMYNRGTINSIVGDFIGNLVHTRYTWMSNTKNYSYGGAICNDNGTITSVVGDFIGNYAYSYSNSGSSGADTRSYGGAIHNNKTITSIEGNFVDNVAYSSHFYGKAYGGAIYNTSTIDSIDGDFIGNQATTKAYGSAYGGAIYNTSTIDSIDGDFIGNQATTEGSGSGSAYGGAIYNSSTINSIKGNFIGNQATTQGSAYGGAIFNYGTITLGGNTFTDNYVIKGSSSTPNSIYNFGTVNIADGATVTVNDGWQSFNNKQLVMLGSGSTLNMNIGNGTIQDDSLGAITNVGTINATVDFDLTYISAPTSDTITVSSVTQEGFINLTGLKLKGTLDDYKDHEFTKRILINSNGSSDLQLKIAMATSDNKYVLQQGEKTAHSDTFDGTAKWTDTYESYNLSTDIVGNIETATTTTTNDSITFTVTGTKENKSDITVMDTLKVVNQSDLATRNFNATVDGETYTATDDLGKAGAGTININGMPTGGESQGTIDLAGHKGFELDKATTLNLNDVVVKNASAVTGVIDGTSTDAVVNLSNAEIDGNVTNAGTVNLENDSSITGTVTNAGTVNLEISQITGVVNNAGVLNLNEGAQLGSAVTGTGTTNINNDFTLNSVITGNDVVLNGAELTMGTMGMLSGANSFTVEDGSTLNLQNGQAANTNLGNFTLNGDMALKIDGNFAAQQIDTITATSFANPNDSSISITNVNVLTPITDEQFSISPIGTMEDAGVKAALASAIEYNAGDIAMTPIYKYSVAYDKDNAMLQFTRSGGGGGGDLNPAVVAAPVATQVAAQVSLEQTFNYSFSNSDTFMLLPNAERVAIRNRNKYAIAENELPEGANPLYQIQDTSSAWFKPYVSFENVPFKNGPKVNIISYGALAGYDTDLKELKKGWARAWTGFVGYNGANLNYNGVTTNQNGGILGGTLTMYKGNFFNATTLSAGASVGENNTMYGHETTTSLLAGIGNKTGYNLEFIDGKFIVQPSLFLGYTFVKTFDYTNAAGVRIDSDPAHTFQISPGLKFIGNLKHGWQPYIGVNMVWNVLNNSHVKANSVVLPQMSVKPYVQYGIGLQKTIKEHFVAYGQAMIQNGGRNGISLTGGFRWAIGKKHKPIEKVQKDKNEIKVSKKSVINSAKTDKTTVIQKSQPQKISKIRAFFAMMNGEQQNNQQLQPRKL